jgi:hypothetical protein
MYDDAMAMYDVRGRQRMAADRYIPQRMAADQETVMFAS